MLKRILILTAALAMAFAAAAQTTTKSEDLVAFDSIEISNDFEVTFHQADFYRVDWTYDTILNDVVGVSVSGKTLHISLNKKGMSSELKKTYRGRNAPKPILKATVYAPSFSNLTLSENAVFNAADNRIETDVFQLSVTDKAQVSRLSVGADRAVITMDKDGKAALTLAAGQIDIRTARSSALDLKQTSGTLNISAANTSVVTVSGDTEAMATTTQNSSKVTVSGTASTLRHDGKGSSEVDVLNAPVQSAEVTMANSGKLYLSVSETLRVDLKGGSSVYFSGEPQISVVNIVSSTLTRYTGKK